MAGGAQQARASAQAPRRERGRPDRGGTEGSAARARRALGTVVTAGGDGKQGQILRPGKESAEMKTEGSPGARDEWEPRRGMRAPAVRRVAGVREGGNGEELVSTGRRSTGAPARGMCLPDAKAEVPPEQAKRRHGEAAANSPQEFWWDGSGAPGGLCQQDESWGGLLVLLQAERETPMVQDGGRASPRAGAQEGSGCAGRQTARGRGGWAGGSGTGR